MNRTPILGAVILAAGLSSRMGALKPCLPFGMTTALGRVTGALETAGVTNIVVVTGHDRFKTATEAGRLGLTESYNPAYELGMFTSVQTGSRALSQEVDSFFVLPVDCPLVTPGVVTALMESYQTDDDVLYPICCGRRGHPPLLSSRLRGALRAADKGSNLRAFLESQAQGARDVEVTDISPLLDMDTPEDYRRLAVFADAIDGWKDRSACNEPRLSDDDVSYLLRVLEVEGRVIRHCRTVAAVAETLAKELNAAGSRLDVRLLRSAALLHDMAKGNRRHAADGETVLARLGLPSLGRIVGSHMVLPDEEINDSCVSEAQLVYLADKMVVEDRADGLEARAEYALRTYGRDQASVEAIKKRMRAAQTITAKIEASLGRPIQDALSGLLPTPESR